MAMGSMLPFMQQLAATQFEETPMGAAATSGQGQSQWNMGRGRGAGIGDVAADVLDRAINAEVTRTPDFNPYAGQEQAAGAEAELKAAQREYAPTQTRRFRGGLMGAGEGIFDAIQEKRKRPGLEQAEQKYLEQKQGAADAQFQQFMSAAQENGMTPQQAKAAWVSKQTGINIPTGQGEEDKRKSAAKEMGLSGEAAQHFVLTGKIPDWYGKPAGEAGEGRIIKDANGFNRYVDGDMAGELVFSEGLEINPDAEQILKTEEGLRGEVNKLLGDFYLVSDAYARVAASGQDPSAAGDMALIFNYMKMLDPGSTVRDSEYATAENAGSVPARVVAQYNKLRKGESLSAEQRADFLDRAQRLYQAQAESAGATASAYEEIATSNGVNVGNVMAVYNQRRAQHADRGGDEGGEPKPAPAAPGTISYEDALKQAQANQGNGN